MSRVGTPHFAVLAAGRASRMGRNKLVLDLDGAPLVRRVAEAAAASAPTAPLVVVAPASRTAIETALDGLAVRIVPNPRHLDGMGTSIAAAAAALPAEAPALVLLQGDQPLVDAEMLAEIVAAWAAGGVAWVASSYGGLVTTPVLFDAELLAELRALGGDRGARAVLDRHGGRGRVLDFPAWRGADVDTPEDYERLRTLRREHGEGA